MRGLEGGGSRHLLVRLDVLLSELPALRQVRTTFGTPIQVDGEIRERIALLGRDRRAREAVVSAPPPDVSALAEQLSDIGFTRELKPFQLRNLARILALPHAADFSVPGAGKTTVALANYAIQRSTGAVMQALIVAPISAFSTWQEETCECFEDPPELAIHIAGRRIPTAAELLVANYHRLSSDYPALRAWAARRTTHVILDEAHRVKRGRTGVHGRAALDIAFAAARRDILTGTPAPQGASDLVALVSYLYPGQARQILPPGVFVPRLALDDGVLQSTNEAIARYFVRTRKSELGLPPTKMTVVAHAMGPVQGAVYAGLIGTYSGELALPSRDRHALRRLGQIVMYLLEAATNPLLLPAGSDEHDLRPFAHPPVEFSGDERLRELIGSYGLYERPWKYDYVRSAVEAAAETGEKTIVWTNFVRNIRLLEADLETFGPAVVHGGIPPRASASPSTSRIREDELDRFRYDPKCHVLLANPAAAGEGVSLHHWCHHAIYLDRTFNAGHFLQSQDRIHRLGLANDVTTRFTLLISEGAIDEAVDDRLRAKVQALALLMNDPGLVRVSLPDAEEEDGENQPAFEDDVEAVLTHVGVEQG